MLAIIEAKSQRLARVDRPIAASGSIHKQTRFYQCHRGVTPPAQANIIDRQIFPRNGEAKRCYRSYPAC